MNYAASSKLIANLASPFVESWNENQKGAYDFVLTGKSRKWEVMIWFPERFPYCLPKARMLDNNLIGIIPHVNQAGVICIEESDSLFIDYTRPDDILCRFIKDLVKFLDRVSLSIYRDELLDEIEGFFSPEKKVNSFYHASDNAEILSLRTSLQKNRRGPHHFLPIALLDRKSSPPPNFSNVRKLGQYQVVNILHMPLEKAAVPPTNGECFSAQYFQSLTMLVSEINNSRISKLIKKFRRSKTFFLLLSMPRSVGERTQLLLRFNSERALEHPLTNASHDWEIDLFSIIHNSRQYLLERGGAEVNLSFKKVAIIGCGSVGSQVANMLAKGGVGELVLIDDDIFVPDNIYRHHLGGGCLDFIADEKSGRITYWKKADVLRRKLENDIPHSKVHSKPCSIFQVIHDRDLLNSDAVVVAVGEPAVNLQINELFKNNNFKNIIFCWNEASGIGGHSIALNLQKMCYQCLHTDGQQLTANNKLALLVGGQPISKNLTGCGGVFTPFSFLDSNRTAELAASQAINILHTGETGIASSWKGENVTSLTTTTRFNSMPLKEKISLEKNPLCRMCND